MADGPNVKRWIIDYSRRNTGSLGPLETDYVTSELAETAEEAAEEFRKHYWRSSPGWAPIVRAKIVAVEDSITGKRRALRPHIVIEAPKEEGE